ncbi:MAG TPA: DNA polymerase IV, partial [Dyadobacter sp.]|nr:DNA polymerase IV [Dyadobacter sp.]
ELNLTASAGISTNKFVAKIASDINKPDGLTFIGPSKIQKFIHELPVEKFFGVGKVTAEKMNGLNLFTGADLYGLTEEELVRHFGKSGHFYYNIARGIDNRQVQPHRESKSLGAEDTFMYDLATREEMQKELERIAVTVFNRLGKKQLSGRTVTLKIKYSDFTQITRNHSFLHPISDYDNIYNTAVMLLDKADLEEKTVRLLGISLSNFGEMVPKGRKPKDPDQLDLFDANT